MFDVAPTELLLVAAVALIVIGPKDLPNVMRTVGRWVGKARGVASHFRSGFDQMVRDAEMEEMEKRWAAENARIMREHPAPADTGALPAPLADDGSPSIGIGSLIPQPFDPGGPLDMEPPRLPAAAEHDPAPSLSDAPVDTSAVSPDKPADALDAPPDKPAGALDAPPDKPAGVRTLP